MEIKPCHMCDNARVNSELTDDNDMSAFGIGTAERGYRMMLCAGNRKPLRVEVERWAGDHWALIGYYDTPFCPNCGRRITEYAKEAQDDEP